MKRFGVALLPGVVSAAVGQSRGGGVSQGRRRPLPAETGGLAHRAAARASFLALAASLY